MGIGPGQFAYYYPAWQIQYVRTHNGLPWKYLFNADEIHVANNEYIQTLMETGLIGFLAFSLLILYLMQVKSTETCRAQIFAVKLTIITILTACFYSYSLHCNVVFFIFVFGCAVLSANSSTKVPVATRNRRLHIFAFPLLLTLIIVSLFQTFRLCYYVNTWNVLSNNLSLSPNQINSEYRTLYPVLKENGKFLLDYGEHLLRADKTVKAAKILEESKKFYLSYRTYFSTADACYQSGNVRGAISNIEQLSNLVPYKFYPKYQLVKLYYSVGDSINGKRIGKILLSMPVKVMSPEVMNYKQEVMQILCK